MSVLIKDMRIPSDCRECPLSEYHERTGKTWCKPADGILADNYKSIPFDGRHEWCPLVDLPEHHGDLVDVKEIRWDDHYDSDGNLSKYKIAYSDEMPDPVIKEEELSNECSN